MAVLGPGSDRPAAVRPKASRRTAADGFFVPRGMPPLGGRGKKPAEPLREGDRGAAVPRALIRPFEAAWDAPAKRTDGDHHDCRHRRRTRTWHRRSHQDLRPRINAEEGVTWRMTVHDCGSWCPRWGGGPEDPGGSMGPALGVRNDDAPTSISSQVTGKGGDDSFTLIWSHGSADLIRQDRRLAFASGPELALVTMRVSTAASHC